jgi:hypothetical protein
LATAHITTTSYLNGGYKNLSSGSTRLSNSAYSYALVIKSLGDSVWMGSTYSKRNATISSYQHILPMAELSRNGSYPPSGHANYSDQFGLGNGSTMLYSLVSNMTKTGGSIKTYKDGSSHKTWNHGDGSYNFQGTYHRQFSKARLVGEVVIYNSALSDSNRQSLESYLENKWGL